MSMSSMDNMEVEDLYHGMDNYNCVWRISETDGMVHIDLIPSYVPYVPYFCQLVILSPRFLAQKSFDALEAQQNTWDHLHIPAIWTRGKQEHGSLKERADLDMAPDHVPGSKLDWYVSNGDIASQISWIGNNLSLASSTMTSASSMSRTSSNCILKGAILFLTHSMVRKASSLPSLPPHSKFVDDSFPWLVWQWGKFHLHLAAHPNQFAWAVASLQEYIPPPHFSYKLAILACSVFETPVVLEAWLELWWSSWYSHWWLISKNVLGLR